MSQWKENWQWKLISVLIGVLLWSFVIAEVNPSQRTTIRGVAIDVRNENELESQDLKITSMEPATVSFNVSGKRNALGNASSQNYQAYVDVSNLREGTQSVPIRYELPSGILLDDTVTENVNVVVEKVITKDLPITVKLEGNLKENYILEGTTPTPSKITVVGARSAVERIDTLTTSVLTEGIEQDTTVNVPIKVLDHEGVEVTGVTLGQSFANVAISIMKTKDVPIRVVQQNEPAADTRIKSIRVVPDSILIKGKKAAVDTVTAINTETVDLSQIRADGERKISLNMPAGVVAVDPNREIRIAIDVDLQENKIVEIPIDKIVLPIISDDRKLSIVSGLDVINVTVKGFAEDLVAITADNVEVKMTLDSNQPGTRRGTLEATVPESATIVSISPSTLAVMVELVEEGSSSEQSITAP